MRETEASIPTGIHSTGEIHACVYLSGINNFISRIISLQI